MNNIFLKVGFVIVILIFIACSANKNVKKEVKTIEVISFTKQYWNGGLPGIGGINFEIKLVVNEQIRPDSLWTEVYGSSLSMHKNGLPIDEFKLGDTILLKGGVKKKNIKPQQSIMVKTTIDTIPAPISYDGKGLMSYFVGDAKKYLVLDSMEILETINYK